MLRVATRRSALATAQATQVAHALDDDAVLVPMATTGDRHPDRAVASFDTKGLFVDTIRAAVLAGDCHLAVHSAKDLPADPVEGLTIGAYPVRADARDVLISRDGHLVRTLPSGATVGTSSARRRLQLLRVRPDLRVVPLRGNIDTRLRRVSDGDFDAVVVAMAGLRRLYTAPEAGGIGALGLPLSAVTLEPGECLPAPAQGALALECRSDDPATLDALAQLDHAPTRTAVTAERAFQRALGGGCLTPIGALATVRAGQIELAGMLADPDSRHLVRQTTTGSAVDPRVVGRDLAGRIRTLGGEAMLAAARQLAAAAEAGSGS